MYGPVRTVVWEGSSRKARPYPDPPVKRRRRGVAALVESKKSLSAPEWAEELTLFLLKYLIRTEPKTFRRPLRGEI